MTTQANALYPTASQPNSTRGQTFARLGGAAALLTLLTALAEILITFLPDGYLTAGTVTEWFALLQANPFLGLRNLGLLNMVMTGLSIPMMYALYCAHRDRGSLPALALIMSLMGAAVFYATNRALPLLALSHQYAAADAAQRAALEAAGLAMLATGQSHTPGTFLGFFFSSISGILMALAMLRGKAFPKAAGVTGAISFGFLLAFDVFASFAPETGSQILGLAMVGGLANLAWLLLTGLRLLQRGANEPDSRS